MQIVQKLVQFQACNLRILRKTSFIIPNKHLCNKKIGSNNLKQTNHIVFINDRSVYMPGMVSYSTSTTSTDTVEFLDDNVYENACEETLQSLTELFEELVESRENLKSADVFYSSGVLTVNLGNKYGTYVINRQSPNKQIWLSSPKSGPKRYDYVVSGSYWIYKHDLVPLHKLLQTEISDMLGEKIDFSKCLHSKV